MGKTERSSTHFAWREFAIRGAVGVLSVEVVLFTVVSPTRRAPVRIGRPPPYVLRDTARQSLLRPPCHRSVLVLFGPYRQTPAANSKGKSHVPSRRIPPQSLPAIACSRPAAR